MITQEYMDEAYVGAIADPLMSVDAVSGATATSQAVCYAVQTAGYYVQNALGYVPDTNAADNADLNAAYPAEYEPIETDYKPSRECGSLVYAANGVAADGTQVLGMKVKGAMRFSYKGSAGHRMGRCRTQSLHHDHHRRQGHEQGMRLERAGGWHPSPAVLYRA